MDKLERKHHADSEEAILDSGSHLNGFKYPCYVCTPFKI